MTDKMNDKEIADKHREFHEKLGVNPFALLDIASRYADTIKADNEMAGPLNDAYNDLAALQVKYADLIKRFQANLPQNRRMIAEALPIIKGG